MSYMGVYDEMWIGLVFFRPLQVVSLHVATACKGKGLRYIMYSYLRPRSNVYLLNICFALDQESQFWGLWVDTLDFLDRSTRQYSLL